MMIFSPASLSWIVPHAELLTNNDFSNGTTGYGAVMLPPSLSLTGCCASPAQFVSSRLSLRDYHRGCAGSVCPVCVQVIHFGHRRNC